LIHHQEGVPQIVCSIDIDANGVLSVTAKDNATGKRIRIVDLHPKEDIERMKQEAEENKDADNLERETVDKLNSADSLIFQTEKQIKEFDENYQKKRFISN
jgi:molecular chaperone DnaK